MSSTRRFLDLVHVASSSVYNKGSYGWLMIDMKDGVALLLYHEMLESRGNQRDIPHFSLTWVFVVFM